MKLYWRELNKKKTELVSVHWLWTLSKGNRIWQSQYPKLAGLEEQGELMTLWKVSVHTGKAEKEKADKPAKEGITRAPGYHTQYFSHTDYILSIQIARNMKWEEI